MRRSDGRLLAVSGGRGGGVAVACLMRGSMSQKRCQANPHKSRATATVTLLRSLPRAHSRLMLLMQPGLGLPRAGFDVLALTLLPGAQFLADPRTQAVMVRGLDQPAAGMAVAGLGDSALAALAQRGLDEALGIAVGFRGVEAG